MNNVIICFIQTPTVQNQTRGLFKQQGYLRGVWLDKWSHRAFLWSHRMAMSLTEEYEVELPLTRYPLAYHKVVSPLLPDS